MEVVHSCFSAVQAFDVYKANSRFSRKKPSGLLMQVHMSQGRPPSRDGMCAAEASRLEDEAIFYATTAEDCVSMYSFKPVSLPNLLQTTDQSSKQGS